MRWQEVTALDGQATRFTTGRLSEAPYSEMNSDGVVSLYPWAIRATAQHV
jgi:hypothetical protein